MPQISDHNLTVSKLKCIFNSHKSYKEMELTSNSGISKTIHHIFCNLLLFRKKNLKKIEKF